MERQKQATLCDLLPYRGERADGPVREHELAADTFDTETLDEVRPVSQATAEYSQRMVPQVYGKAALAHELRICVCVCGVGGGGALVEICSLWMKRRCHSRFDKLQKHNNSKNK
uniref:Uncharacterized protein n=1 Tax=Trypanosoma vivax (strain Y486) TaxID=1055687 RepID=G0TVK0_TRYVY|nr:hypothetical protein, unlikely [Trypanosoma vivax Y486]